MFLKKKNKKIDRVVDASLPKKRKFWKLFFVVLGILIIFVISLFSYAVSSGSKIFEKGIGGGSDIIKTLYGSKEVLEGEKEDRINVLLFGSGGVNHPGGLLTDSIMILSVRPSDNKAALISVPRDLWVKMPSGEEGKINSVLSIGYNSYLSKNCTRKKNDLCRNEALIAGTRYESDLISSLFDIPIHYYISSDFSGFEKLIDQLGGVDVTVEKDIYDPEYPDEAMEEFSPFYIKSGQKHLDGKTALKYARSRHGTAGGDFDRAARQQQILTAMKDKAIKSGMIANPKKILDMIDTLGNSVRTNLTMPEMKVFLSIAEKIDRNNINSKVLSTGKDGYLESSSEGTYRLLPKGGNYTKINSMIKNIFNGSEESAAKVEIYNSSGVPGVALSLSKELAKSNEIDVVSVLNSKPTLEKTIIYDYTNGSKKKALNDLSGILKAKILQGEADKQNSASEIAVYLGKDYNTAKN